MSTVEEDIKSRQFQKVYLLCGNEGYLRNQYRNFLKKAMCEGLDSMNVNCYEGKDIEVPKVIEMADTMPFFADRRVVIVENSGLFSSAGEKMVEYLEHQSEMTNFIFVEESPDKRSKLYKFIDSKGKVENYEMLQGDKLQSWVGTIIKQSHKQMTGNAYQLLVEKTGSDMSNMRSELEKVICYTGEREQITAEDVEAVCTTRITSKIYELVDEIARQNQTKALKIYGDMVALREPPMRILYSIARQFNQLLIAKELKQKGFDKYTMAGKMGVQPFIADKCAQQASKFSIPAIKEVIRACVDIENDFKTGKISEGLAAELIIIRYSTPKEKSTGKKP